MSKTQVDQEIAEIARRAGVSNSKLHRDLKNKPWESYKLDAAVYYERWAAGELGDGRTSAKKTPKKPPAKSVKRRVPVPLRDGGVFDQLGAPSLAAEAPACYAERLFVFVVDGKPFQLVSGEPQARDVLTLLRSAGAKSIDCFEVPVWPAIGIGGRKVELDGDLELMETNHDEDNAAQV